MLMHLSDDQGEHRVEIVRRGEGWLVTIDGVAAQMEVTPDGSGGWSVAGPDGRRTCRVAARRDERFVFADGRTHHLRLVDPDHPAGDEAARAGPNLRAGMPGKVVRVLVADGAVVAAGQALVILESMKMETELTAAAAGTVVRIHVGAGQVVAQDDPLVDVDPTGAPA